MDKARTTLVSMIALLLIFPGVIIGLVLAGPLTPAQAPTNVDVAVVGASSAPAIMTSLGLDESSISISEAASIAAAVAGTPNTIILIDTPIGLGDLALLNSFLTNGGGLFILLGPSMTADGTGFQYLGITTSDILEASPENANVITRMMDQTHPIMNIDWSSAPPTEKVTVLPDLGASSTSLLANDTGFGTGGAPLLVHTSVGSGNILVYTPWLTLNSTAETQQTNYELVLWPYFNYFLYSSSVYLSSQSPLTYAEWSYSPVPHFEQQLIIGILVLVIGIVTVSSYRGMKKKSQQRKEVLTAIEMAELLSETEGEVDEWEEIGMHRQLGGFLIQLFITLLLVIPRVVLSVMIYPTFIMPFPQAAGWFSFSVNLFLGVWTLFDLGTSVALAKYFAEYRVSQPEEAIKYAQIFVWFQCITGVVQISIVAFVGSIIFPHTYLAHLSYVFIAHSLFQFPGFTLLFIHVFRGMNRIDYQQITNILKYVVFDIAGPYILILLFRWWGAQNPIFGEALGGAIGQAIGSYFSEWLVFIVSIFLFRKLGFKVSTLFRVDFNREQIRRAMKFGAKWTVGAATVPLVWFYQMLLISTNLLNWSALQGQFQLAWDLAIMVSVVGLFMESMLGGVSESYSHGKKKLTELYTAQGLKYGAFFVFWLIAILAATGARAILGAAGPNWAYAAVLLQFFLIFQLFGWLSWLGDWMFAGAERTGLAAGVWVAEQTIRAIAMTLFVIYEPVWFGIYLGGMPGIIVGYVIGLVIKDIIAWIVIRRKISKPKFYIWQTYIGPGIAAIMVYFILEFIAQQIWQGDLITSALLFFIAVLPSLYLYSFFSGLTGTWDERTLTEFKRASDMVRIRGIGWLARRFYGSIALGARISPLHDRFPIGIYDEAMLEAEELTLEKKELRI
ncbi:MAG: oligosaccharide flippase family protein [Candidatus Thorarchaeota archaeon]|nr:oligosaccharide flippase family protein [Candidatus Thorarchaeota archaeon]